MQEQSIQLTEITRPLFESLLIEYQTELDYQKYDTELPEDILTAWYGVRIIEEVLQSGTVEKIALIDKMASDYQEGLPLPEAFEYHWNVISEKIQAQQNI